MATRVFKTDATYQTSITFYDNYQRKCGISLTPAGKITTPDRTYAFTSYVSTVGWTLLNTNALAEIPVWAYYYSINITRCLRTRFFLQMRSADNAYAVKQTDGTYLFTTSAYATTLDGCAFDISTLNAVALGYSFTLGDIVKIYIGSNVFSLAITGQQGSWIITELQNLGTLDAATQSLFEIYTPYKPSTSEPAYEVGQIFAVNNPATSARSYSVLSGNIQGDVWLLTRKGVNNFYYEILPGNIGVAEYTVGVNYISQDVSDSNVTTGNSPLQSLAGFDITTNNDRWIQQIGGTAEDFKISGILKVQVSADTPYLLYLDDNTNNVRALVNQATLSAGVIYSLPFDINYTGNPSTKIFMLVKMNGSTTTFFSLENFVIQSINSSVIYTVEAMSPNDKFYQNWFTDAGRPNFVDTIGQTVLRNTISYSNTFIAGSKINGLSTYDALDTTDMPQECGPLQRLILTSKVVAPGHNDEGAIMLAICSRETASLYLGEVQVVAQSTNAFLASAPGVIGTINILKGSYGTRNPESAQQFKGNVFWFDANNGKYIQYGINGLFPISNYSITKYWKLFAEAFLAANPQQIEDWGFRPFVFTGVDPHNGELLISVPQTLADPPKGYLPDYPTMPYPFDIWDGRGKSVVYKLYESPNWWQGSYDIPAENFIYAGNALFAFKNGVLWQLNSETFQGAYLGFFKPSRVMFASNQQPKVPKVWENLSLQSSAIPALSYFRTEFPYIQASDLKDFDQWQTPEGVFYCFILNDKLTPSATGLSPSGLINGDKIRGTVMLVMLEWDSPASFRFVTFSYNASLGHNTA